MFLRHSKNSSLIKQKIGNKNLLSKNIKNVSTRNLNFRIFYRYGRRWNNFLFRDYSIGLKFLMTGRISVNVFEAVRRIFRRILFKNIKFFIQAFPFSVLTKRPSEVRMGRGKAARICNHISIARAGKILYKVESFKNLGSVFGQIYLFEEYRNQLFQLMRRLDICRFKTPSSKTKLFFLFL